MARGPRGMSTEKPRDRKKVLLRLWKYLYAHKWLLLLAFVLTVSSNVLALIGPTLSGWAIDSIGTVPGAVNFSKVFYYCGLMIVFYLVSSALSYILSVLMIHFSHSHGVMIQNGGKAAISKAHNNSP